MLTINRHEVKKFLKRDLTRIATLVIAVILLVFSLSLLGKVTATAIKLAIISDNISFANQNGYSGGWTDSLKKDVEKQIALRNELINSDDKVESTLASGNNFVQLFIILGALALPIIPVYWILLMIRAEIRSYIFWRRRVARRKAAQ